MPALLNVSPLIQTYTKYLKQSDGLAAGDSGLFKLIHQLHHILHLFHRDGEEEENRLAQVFPHSKLHLLHLLNLLSRGVPPLFLLQFGDGRSIKAVLLHLCRVTIYLHHPSTIYHPPSPLYHYRTDDHLDAGIA